MVDSYYDITHGKAVLIRPIPKRRRRITSDNDDGLARAPVHDWSVDPKQRLLLFFMTRRYSNDLEDVTNIFNLAFADVLKGPGLQKRKLNAQLGDRTTRQIPYVDELLSVPEKSLPKVYGDVHELVINAAEALDILLVHKYAAGPVVASKKSLKRKQRAPTAGIDSDSSVDMSTYDTDFEVESMPKASKRTARGFHTTSPRGARIKTSTIQDVAELLTPPQSAVSHMRKVNSVPTARPDRDLLPAIAFTPPETSSTTYSQSTNAPRAVRRKLSPLSTGIPSHDGVPFLLFRCWDGTSHGTNTAAGFASGLRLDGPPLIDTDPGFLRHAAAHLNNDRIRPQPSPFISFTTSLPTALRKAAAKMKESGSPIIAVLDGRAVAMQTRLYHTAAVIENVRSERLRIPFYPGNGEFEYWAWQKTSAIIGYVSLEQLHRWTQDDDCLGALLRHNDISRKGGVSAFRKECHNAIPLHANLGRSIGSLARLFRPTITQHVPFLKDFTRVILQNFNLTEDLNDWEENVSFTDGLFALPETDTSQFAPHANDPQQGDQGSDDGFEDVDDVLRDVGNTSIEVEDAVATNTRLKIITIEDDDDDHDFGKHLATVDQSSAKHIGSSNAKPRPRRQPSRREQIPQTPLAHRTRFSSISSDELTISLPPSPYDTMRAQMRIAAQHASPTPAPRTMPRTPVNLEVSPAVATDEAHPENAWLDREAAMQQMLSVVAPQERQRWALAFDMYVRGLVTDIMAEGGDQ